MFDLIHATAAALHAIIGDAVTDIELADLTERAVAEQMTPARW